VEHSINGNAIIVYPNPNSGNFGITLYSAKEASLRIELSDAIGQTVFADVMKVNVGENKIAIADKNLAKGIYLLKVDIGENRYLNKVIVQ
jgi:tRNA-binding EMAP/Myf-like protein